MGQVFIETHAFFWNVLYLPINSIAIAFALPFLSKLNSVPSFILKPITYISVLSYAMYLLHYSVVLQLMKYFYQTDNLTNIGLMIYIGLYFIFTILLSYMLYQFFEKPITDLRDLKSIKSKFNR